ncbi:MAG: DUF975 family protein [Clostridiales Family XIII bacterium]|jgi:uncharacterized membrane protein|nr:DUF975 family protein [Clostridiales Family XIII bacterium]
MNLNPILVTEPVGNFRRRAADAMRGRVSMLYLVGLIYISCLTIPTAVIEGLNGTFNKLAEVMQGISTTMDVQKWYAENADALQATSNFSALYGILVTGTFALGLTIVHLAVIRRQEATSLSLFDGFAQLPKAVAIYVLTRIMIFLWTLLFVVPGVIAYYRYSLVYYIVIDNPQIGTLQAIRMSGDLMRGNKMKRFVLDLSFIPWCIPPVVIIVTILSFFSPSALESGGNALFALYMFIYVLVAVLFSFVLNYRGVAAADFYQKVGNTD